MSRTEECHCPSGLFRRNEQNWKRRKDCVVDADRNQMVQSKNECVYIRVSRQVEATLDVLEMVSR